jgi:hypothetical protein
MNQERLLARNIYPPRKNPRTVSIKGRARRSEGIETNSFNDDYGAWPGARIVPQDSAPTSVCRPPQARGPLPAIRRARPLIVASSE